MMHQGGTHEQTGSTYGRYEGDQAYTHPRDEAPYEQMMRETPVVKVYPEPRNNQDVFRLIGLAITMVSLLTFTVICLVLVGGIGGRDAITLIEGLALQKPRRSMAAIHRQVTTVALEKGWKPPGYDRVRHIIKELNPALVTLAHQEAAVCREEFDLLYRRESTHENAMWQADHTPLDVLLLDETDTPAKPWLTAIEDDYSRMIIGYRLSFQESTALTTVLTLRQAIWRKEDPRWHAYGIPKVFYTDYGSDFTSKHMEHILVANQLAVVTKEVMETARENLIIGLSY